MVCGHLAIDYFVKEFEKVLTLPLRGTFSEDCLHTAPGLCFFQCHSYQLGFIDEFSKEGNSLCFSLAWRSDWRPSINLSIITCPLDAFVVESTLTQKKKFMRHVLKNYILFPYWSLAFAAFWIGVICETVEVFIGNIKLLCSRWQFISFKILRSGMYTVLEVEEELQITVTTLRYWMIQIRNNSSWTIFIL